MYILLVWLLMPLCIMSSRYKPVILSFPLESTCQLLATTPFFFSPYSTWVLERLCFNHNTGQVVSGTFSIRRRRVHLQENGSWPDQEPTTHSLSLSLLSFIKDRGKSLKPRPSPSCTVDPEGLVSWGRVGSCFPFLQGGLQQAPQYQTLNRASFVSPWRDASSAKAKGEKAMGEGARRFASYALYDVQSNASLPFLLWNRKASQFR